MMTVGKAAALDPSGKYRYALWRWWVPPDRGLQFRSMGPRDRTAILVPVLRTVLWVMLNPSTADAAVDDNTIRRCLDFSHGWGFEALAVVNLFAFRATRTSALMAEAAGGDAVGPENPGWIDVEARNADRIVLAWGALANTALVALRANTVKRQLAGRRLYCLGHTKGGHPRHPLYARGDQGLECYGETPYSTPAT